MTKKICLTLHDEVFTFIIIYMSWKSKQFNMYHAVFIHHITY